MQSSHNDLLSIITRFFNLISFAFSSLKSNVFTLKSIVSLSHHFFSTNVILLYAVLIEGNICGDSGVP